MLKFLLGGIVGVVLTITAYTGVILYNQHEYDMHKQHIQQLERSMDQFKWHDDSHLS